MADAGIQQQSQFKTRPNALLKKSSLVKIRKKTYFYYQALVKKFYLVTSISGKTLTDQTVEQHIRAILVITVITEYSTVTTKIFLKKCLFFPPHTFSFFTS